MGVMQQKILQERSLARGPSLPSRDKPCCSLTTVLGPEFILQSKGWGETPAEGALRSSCS